VATCGGLFDGQLTQPQTIHRPVAKPAVEIEAKLRKAIVHWEHDY